MLRDMPNHNLEAAIHESFYMFQSFANVALFFCPRIGSHVLKLIVIVFQAGRREF